MSSFTLPESDFDLQAHLFYHLGDKDGWMDSRENRCPVKLLQSRFFLSPSSGIILRNERDFGVRLSRVPSSASGSKLA